MTSLSFFEKDDIQPTKNQHVNLCETYPDTKTEDVPKTDADALKCPLANEERVLVFDPSPDRSHVYTVVECSNNKSRQKKLRCSRTVLTIPTNSGHFHNNQKHTRSFERCAPNSVKTHQVQT